MQSTMSMIKSQTPENASGDDSEINNKDEEDALEELEVI